MRKVIQFTCKMKGVTSDEGSFLEIFQLCLSLLLFTFGTVYVSKKVEGIDPGVIPSKDFRWIGISTIEFSSIR